MSDLQSDESPSCSSDGQTKSQRSERLNKLRALELRMNEARKMNHKEVVEEDRRSKLPSNYETRKKFVEWEEAEESKRKEAEGRGEDYDRVKLLDIGADDMEKWNRKKKKKNPDPGFSDYEAATARQYQRLTKQIKPNKEEYNKQKDAMGENFYPTVDTLGIQQHKDSEEAVDRMVTDLNKQIDKRSKYSRRRTHDEDADIDYINERNMKYNKKLERFYGKYTNEIKQNLERGTAV